MRLICPNCGAQYEVSDDVIPVAGRDVQCSNCGHTWFEHPGASEAAEAGDPLPPPVPAPTPAAYPEFDTPADPEREPDFEPVPEHQATDQTPTDAILPEPTPREDPPVDPGIEQTVLTAAGLQRRSLSPDLAEILRQEAEHEAAARAAEAPARNAQQAETTSAVDLDDQRGEEARRRMARMRGEAAPAISAPPAATPTARRELLPDIEEINSSLRSTTDRNGQAAAAEPAVQQRKRGARFGFSTIMLLVAILVGLYLGAARLSALIPSAEPVLTRYVAVIDDVRLWIDLKMQAFIAGQSDGAVVSDPATPATDPPAVDDPAIEGQDGAPPAPETDPPAEPPAEQTNG